MKNKTLNAIGDELLHLSAETKEIIIEEFVKNTIQEFEDLSHMLGISAEINGELTNKRTGRKHTIIIKSEDVDDEELEELEKAMSN